MGSMSDLHLLANRVLDGEDIEKVSEDTNYDKEEIKWAVEEISDFEIA